MIDYINSLDRKGLVIIGRKVKAPGYLNNFEDPQIDEETLRKLVIDNISDNKVKKKIKSKKSNSPKKRINGKKSAKRTHESLDEDFKKYVKLEYPLGNCLKIKLFISKSFSFKKISRFSIGNSSPSRMILGVSIEKFEVFVF